MSEDTIINYSEAFPKAIAAQGKGKNFLALYRMDEPFKRADGKMARYELDYRWLSEVCVSEKDESWCCVQGQEHTYYMKKELPDLVKLVNGEVSLFDMFRLFP